MARFIFFCILALRLFAKKTKKPTRDVAILLSKLCRRIKPTTFLFDDGNLSVRLYHQSKLDGKDYSWTIKTFSSIHFTTVHANLIEQTTSSMELLVLRRRIIDVIRKDSTCLLLH